jgi:tetratricopeptide (TPR) repeat protein
LDDDFVEQQGDLGGAEKDYLYAVNLHPESFEAHKNLALLYHKQQKFEKAIKHYEISEFFQLSLIINHFTQK